MLETTAQLPLLALQIMKLLPRAKLTLTVDTGEDYPSAPSSASCGVESIYYSYTHIYRLFTVTSVKGWRDFISDLEVSNVKWEGQEKQENRKEKQKAVTQCGGGG
jgi:hypothetical protein